jgi:acyl dehydratase
MSPILTVDAVDNLLAMPIGHLGETECLEVPQAQVDAFAKATEDHQWIHVDPDRARTGPYGATIAHGMLTLSLVPSFIVELVDVASASAVLNYGFDRVRFVAPVPVGSRIRGAVMVKEVKEVRDGVRVTFTVEVSAEGAPTCACVADLLLLWVR